jgi:NAD(P)-dependent dehydrogenase (short-subunit alcohol dehydrogenase family)
LVEELEHYDAHVIGFVADICNKDQMQNVAEGTVRRFGRIDTWVHVTGVSLFGKFEETSEEEFVRMMGIHSTYISYNNLL